MPWSFRREKYPKLIQTYCTYRNKKITLVKIPFFVAIYVLILLKYEHNT